MTNQKQQIEALLGVDASEGEWPPVAARFLESRERTGLSQNEVADRLGIRPSEYWDIELHNSEAFHTFSVTNLRKLASIFSTPLTTLLFGAGSKHPSVYTSYTEIARLLADLATAENLTIDQLGDRIGWELKPLVENPEAIGNLNIVGLRDVCRAVDVDWVSALPVN